MLPPDPPQPRNPAEFVRRRRGRNLAMFAALVAVCVVFFVLTLVKLGAQH